MSRRSAKERHHAHESLCDASSQCTLPHIDNDKRKKSLGVVHAGSTTTKKKVSAASSAFVLGATNKDNHLEARHGLDPLQEGLGKTVSGASSQCTIPAMSQQRQEDEHHANESPEESLSEPFLHESSRFASKSTNRGEHEKNLEGNAAADSILRDTVLDAFSQSPETLSKSDSEGRTLAESFRRASSEFTSGPTQENKQDKSSQKCEPAVSSQRTSSVSNKNRRSTSSTVLDEAKATTSATGLLASSQCASTISRKKGRAKDSKKLDLNEDPADEMKTQMCNTNNVCSSPSLSSSPEKQLIAKKPRGRPKKEAKSAVATASKSSKRIAANDAAFADDEAHGDPPRTKLRKRCAQVQKSSCRNNADSALVATPIAVADAPRSSFDLAEDFADELSLASKLQMLSDVRDPAAGAASSGVRIKKEPEAQQAASKRRAARHLPRAQVKDNADSASSDDEWVTQRINDADMVSSDDEEINLQLAGAIAGILCFMFYRITNMRDSRITQ